MEQAVDGDYQALEQELQGAQSMFALYKAEYDSAKQKYDDAVEQGMPLYDLTAQTNGLKDLELKMRNASQNVETKKNQISAVADNPKGETKTLQAIKRILIKNGSSISAKYKLDLSLKTDSGVDTGLISPNAMFRLGVLAAQIMYENEWSSVNDEIKENNNSVQNKKQVKTSNNLIINILNKPFFCCLKS